MASINLRLKEIANAYKKYRTQFFDRQEKLISQFKLPADQEREIAFSIIETANPELQKYVDVLNKDIQLQELSKKIKAYKLKGNLIILEYLKAKNIQIPGYYVNTLMDEPTRYFEEINNLVLGLGGYQHIHAIKGKLMREVPAKHFLLDNPELIKIVDSWLNELDEICS